MPELIPVQLDEVTVFIESSRSYGSEETSAVDKVAGRIEDSFDTAQTAIVAMAEKFITSVNGMREATKPDELAVEFAIKFSAEGNVVVTKIGGEATFKITMKYTTKKGE